MRRQDNVRKIALFCSVLILVFLILFSGLQILESTVFYDRELAGEQIKTKTISRDGVKYFPRQDLTVVMFLGIDQFGPVVAKTNETNESNADMVALLIFDETNQNCSILYLNRDTMLHVPVLNDAGNPVGSVYGQLTLAHLYGTGLEDSCENTKVAVSNFLYGIRIDHYVSMNMDAISILNDAVGGVTVNVTDDFSRADPSIPMGEVTLRGSQAVSYVRGRRDVGDGLNISRMDRQKEYLQGFIGNMRGTLQGNDERLIKIYEEIAPYIVTDCSANTVTSMMQRYADYTIDRYVTPEGENVLGEYMEFYADEEKLDDLIIDLFYAPK